MTHGHTHLSREEIAKIEIGHTETTPAICRFLTVLFVIVLVSIPLLQNVVEFREIARERARSREDGEKPARAWPQCYDIVRLVPTPTELLGAARAGSLRGVFGRLKEINNRILRDIQTYEQDLKDCSNLVQWLIPRMQVATTGWLRGGNEDAYCGREGWLFYRPDVDYLVGPGFLDPKVLARRAASGNEWKAPPQPDPVKAIVDFRDQLAKRDIQLVVVPTPLKPMIYPERYTRRRVDCRRPLQNASYEEFIASLRAADIAVFDPAPLLAEAKAQAAAPLYLETDTHWTPQGMQLAAEGLVRFVRNSMPLPDAPAPPYATTRAAATNLGDIAVMLRLPSSQTFYRLQSVALSQVTDRTRFWRPDSAADVLLLGDSFANIFSLERMGWGEAAGLPEHLSLALGRPLDALLQNDKGSWKTRGMLATEMKRGNDRLAGKRLVIWQFAARELAFGDWKLIPLELGEKQPTSFFAAAVGESVLVRGVVKAVAPAPRPGSVPYKDHIVMVHLTDLDGPGDARGREAVVLMWSMRDNVWTRAARYRPGEQVRLRIRPWSAVSDKLDAINRAELDDSDLLRQEPNWGEEAEGKGREGNVKRGA